ncbi:putative Xaa-Pro aminopeptidase P [Vitis vinifera]|uniref:Putative Xaa-Pro aminopeptidase P n=1 Tax=Vitis vinifera TaxID=29760 RepID=A0A438I3U7_VITVI|nr:putative Xaa-Pro aminopeptidase P [Vitis vinifera]
MRILSLPRTPTREQIKPPVPLGGLSGFMFFGSIYHIVLVVGFTGSAGTVVVTKDKGALWTDGRYFLQAEKQLSSNWILMRVGNYGVPTTSEWLNDVLAPVCRIGIDPFFFPSDAAEELKEAIAKKNHVLVYLYDLNLVDEIWKESRPEPPRKPIRVHELTYAGLDVSSKLSSLRSELIDAGCSAIVVSMLDEVSWLLNLRGNDVPNSPVMCAYFIVEIDGAKLFIDDSKVSPEVMDHLKNLDTSSVNVAIVNTYEAACDQYSGSLDNKRKNKSEAYGVANGQSGVPTGVYKISPILLAKAVRNQAELEGMRNSHLRDAVALAQFWSWLEEEILKGVLLTEVDVADKLLQIPFYAAVLLKGTCKMCQKLERCKLKIDIIQNVLDGQCESVEIKLSREKNEIGFEASDTDSESYLPLLDSGVKQIDDKYLMNHSLKNQMILKMLLPQGVDGMSIHGISDTGSPRQSSSEKIEEGKDSEDKLDKEPLDNSGYLTRSYLEPLAKMKFRYNCERVVDLDKHEGMRRVAVCGAVSSDKSSLLSFSLDTKWQDRREHLVSKEMDRERPKYD